MSDEETKTAQILVRVSEEERDEWNIIGLLGQVPINKGQPLASNWIKMRDVSATVEMYFIK